jgi:hypothetical protein
VIRNRKSRAAAMTLRRWIANLLASHSQLEPPLTDKDLHRLLGGCISIDTVKRHRGWVRRAHAEGRLPLLLEASE